MSDTEKAGCSDAVENGSEGDNQGISMADYIKAQADLEEDAQAVLGASDANNCTYDQVALVVAHQWK